MKNKLNYALCVFLTLLLTAMVVFMPRFYYSLGNEKTGNARTEKFTMPDLNNSVTDLEVIYRLVNSDSAIWIDEAYNYDAVIAAFDRSIREIYMFFFENEYTKGIFDDIKSYAELGPNLVNSVIVSGDVDGTPVSVSMYYIEYEDSSGGVSVLMNKNTGKIYQILYYGQGYPKNFFDSENYSDSWEYTYTALNKYYNETLSEKAHVEAADGMFCFFVFENDYYDLKYSRNMEIMDSDYYE